MEYIVLAIPVFFVLIGFELWLSYKKNKQLYRMSDAVANISCGVGQQVLGVFFKTYIFAAYVFIYKNYSLFEIPSNPMTWLVLFIGVDFFYYWFHRLSHEVNFIWATHIVHHQSEDYNFSVALRQSWFQGLISWAFYIPLALMGFDPLLIVTVAAFNTLYQFWIHTKTIDKLGYLEWIFNTPSHHRVHHGSNPKYIDKNHGGTLIIWDRLFGTFQAEEEEVIYGITQPIRSWNPVWANFHYWKELYDQSSASSNLRDRILTFVKPPGWRPESAGGMMFPKEIDRDTYRKFDLSIPPILAKYGLVQFAGVLLASVFFLFTWEGIMERGQGLPILLYLAFAGYIIFAIYSLGTGYEMKKVFYRNEWLRFGTGLALGMLMFIHLDVSLTLILFWILLHAVSIIWLVYLHRKKNLSWN